MATPFPEEEFINFIESLTKGLLREKDQLVKINAAVANHTLTCEQVKQIALVTKVWDPIPHARSHSCPADTHSCCSLHPQMCWCSSVVACYPKIVDKENFGEVLKVFKFDEEREEVCERLGLAPDGTPLDGGSEHVRVAPSRAKAILKSDTFQQSYNAPKASPQPKRMFKVPGSGSSPASKPKFCSNCGEKLEIAQKFCGSCGTAVQ